MHCPGRFSFTLGLLLTCATSAVVVAGQRAPRDPLPDPRLVPHVGKLEDLEPVSTLDIAIAKAFDLPGPRLHPGHNEPSSSLGIGLSGESSVSAQTIDPSIPRQVLLRPLCFLDAMVVATPTAVHLITNTSKTKLVTVFELRVSQWIRPTSGPLTVVVPYMGGQAVISGERYQVDYRKQTPLPRLDVRGVAFLMRDRPHTFYTVSGGSLIQEVDGRVTLEGLREPLSAAIAELTSAATTCKDSTR